MWVWYYPCEEEDNGCCYTMQEFSFDEYMDGEIGLTESDWMVPGTVDPNED